MKYEEDYRTASRDGDYSFSMCPSSYECMSKFNVLDLCAIDSGIKNTLEITKKIDKTKDIKVKDIPEEIEKLKALMKIASNSLDFERCIELRDTISALKRKLRN